VAKALTGAIDRKVDIVARYGGEEFVCVLPGTDTEGAKLIGKRLRASLAAFRLPHEYSDVESHVTISLGAVTMTATEGNLSSEIIEKADERLYKAKKGGRNRLVAED